MSKGRYVADEMDETDRWDWVGIMIITGDKKPPPGLPTFLVNHRLFLCLLYFLYLRTSFAKPRSAIWNFQGTKVSTAF